MKVKNANASLKKCGEDFKEKNDLLGLHYMYTFLWNPQNMNNLSVYVV